jgi:septal ring factor EnvC (AmiA/AmiB activator)
LSANLPLPSRRSLICILAGLALAATAQAAEKKTAPVENPAARLKELERQAAESKARAAELAQRTTKIQGEIEAQRQSLTARASEVRDAEEALSRLEGEENALSDSFSKESGALMGDRATLAALTRGLARLTRIPPGGLLAWQGAPIDAARAEMLLQAALTQTRSHAVAAESELENLNALSQQLAAKRVETERAADTLRTRQTELAALITDRQKLYEQTEDDRQAEEERSQKIADEAKDLRDLVARIEAEQAAEERRREEEARKAEAKRKASLRVPPPKPQGHYNGTGAVPVAGQIKLRFGQNDGLGTTSHGVTIVARPGATVTAPASGVVRFSGPFRGYKQILILEHPGGYLSLIAGMTRVTAPVKQAVGTGEPVGMMDERPDARPELYYELRHNGQFVDPQSVTLPVDVKGKVR